MADARSSLKKELDQVESELLVIAEKVEELLQQQQLLTDRRELLTVQLRSLDQGVASSSSNERPVDWENDQFPWSESILSALRDTFHLRSFRPLQLSCINASLSKKDVILIMPTGGGKSLCYQLPAVTSSGFTLVISPLVSLMEDQLMAVKTYGVPSCMLSASSPKEVVNRIHTAMTDKTTTAVAGLKLLYVTPEKIAKSKRFMSKLEKAYELGRLTSIVIDEVHCASQWGHDFRPDYKILGILKRQFPGSPITGLTATATAKVLEDVKSILNLECPLVFKASYNRPNLYYEVRLKPVGHKSQTAAVAELIKGQFSSQSGQSVIKND